MARPWFRLYTEILTDRKIDKIRREASVPRATIIGIWATMLCLANDSPERGALLISESYPVTIDDLVDYSGVGKDMLEAVLEQFKALCMTVQEGEVYHIVNWDKRQFESDIPTERVRRHRAAKAQEADELLPKRYGNAPETETDTETHGANAQLQKPVKRTCPQEWMSALLELCGSDNRIASPGLRKRCSLCGIVLIDSKATLPDLAHFGEWWYENDWRGKMGQCPTPEQVRDTWNKTNGKSKPKSSTITKVYN